MKELSQFISETENFANKYILFLKIGEKGIQEKKILNNNHFLCSKMIDNFFRKTNDISLKKLKSIDHIEVDFDYLLILLENNNVPKYNVIMALEEIKKKAVNNFKLFISWSNRQYIFRKLEKSIKTNPRRINLSFSEEFLLYDYVFHNNFNYKSIKNKCFRKFISLLTKLFDYLIDLNRFSFLSTNVLVKYVYVPKFRLN